jgi:hypothetical protein
MQRGRGSVALLPAPNAACPHSQQDPRFAEAFGENTRRDDLAVDGRAVAATITNAGDRLISACYLKPTTACGM